MQCWAEMSPTVSPFAGACGSFIFWFGCNATTRSCRASHWFRGRASLRVQRSPSRRQGKRATANSHELARICCTPSSYEWFVLSLVCIRVHSWLNRARLAVTLVCLTSCATVSHHQFAEPTAGWQTKTGQLMYRTPHTTLVGEALVRFSNTGDFELTVSKGPGITLLSLQQDARFAEFNAAFTGQRWSGLTAQAPQQLRGWLGLRDQFLRAPNQKTLRYATGSETFLFRF